MKKRGTCRRRALPLEKKKRRIPDPVAKYFMDAVDRLDNAANDLARASRQMAEATAELVSNAQVRAWIAARGERNTLRLRRTKEAECTPAKKPVAAGKVTGVLAAERDAAWDDEWDAD